MRLAVRGQVLCTLVLVLAITGCSTMKSHDTLTTQVHAAQQAGGIPAALKALDASASSDSERKELLFNMERGELLRLNKQYPESTQAFLLADSKVNAWEETAKSNPQKLLGMLGAATISERMKEYEGQDYEKVWLTTRLALNRVAVGDLEAARVDIKRTHEREAVIAEFRSKETVAAEQAAKAKGVETSGKELNGYPVETLNDPEVLALKNGYQNALSHYLAGFLYEVMDESGLAAPGYRKAIELKPETAVLDEGLRGLDERTSFTHRRRQNMTDVLFVIEAGDAPARKASGFTIPIPTGKTIRTVSVSYPIIRPSTDPLLYKLMVADKEFKLQKVVDVNVMARRALKDEMPGLVLRGVTRAIVKNELQKQLEKASPLAGLLGAVASAVTEQADDRMWRRLPGRAYLARGYLPEGMHRVSVDGREFNVKVGGQYALVQVRLSAGGVIVGDVGSFGKLAATPPVPPAQTETPRVKDNARPGLTPKPASGVQVKTSSKTLIKTQ